MIQYTAANTNHASIDKNRNHLDMAGHVVVNNEILKFTNTTNHVYIADDAIHTSFCVPSELTTWVYHVDEI
jgi:hypothetical protein